MKRSIIIFTFCAGILAFNKPPAFANTTNKYLVTDTLKKKVKPLVNYPTLPGTVSRVFYVQRDPNVNTIVYELNMDKDGQLNDDEPVHPYWIRYNEKGQREELSYIQRKFAYGLTQKPLGNGRYDIRFVSYKKYPLTLMKAADGKYHIYATIAQKQVILNRIFVKIEGGSFWLPNVVYVEVKGSDPATGQEIVDRFKP
ncbi:DUF4833 domain-containing protein [Mucilaginibacter polytrichastri]|uniref:DUF4833 domain-containing protein n=1 Tax=Mucilaginibacter polytrichastri TaxID=1302689 RepID=A0A1Q5ZYD8_9SPHI|nr:DUF4833 domain-containing protein [Mucilaginibacter polytrichastri]OKS86785.1 hypothetical protein RG47T_2242 [Mucilaginibacter polytrichastri]SFT22650.1 protein of unknown function [Mucilaginibacter polytrichastri]